jgi:hypothetical protein
MFSDVLPLRAIALQTLFLVVAIACESSVFQRLLKLDYKTSAQYAISVNLFSMVVGWIVFFVVQPLLPGPMKVQLISFVFFAQFLQELGSTTIAPILIVTALFIFMGTFFVKLKGLEVLELMLEKVKTSESSTLDAKSVRLRRKIQQNVGFQVSRKDHAVLVANACSFSAILLILVLQSLG